MDWRILRHELALTQPGIKNEMRIVVNPRRIAEEEDHNMNVQKKSRSPKNRPQVNFGAFTPECDAFLVTQSKSGSSIAFGKLYERHWPKTYSTVLRVLRNQQDAEDAVQQSFQHAFSNLTRFREDSSFSTWLTRIAINEALMLLRRRRFSQPLRETSLETESGQGVAEVVDDRPTPEDILCESERRKALLQAVAQLRQNLRIVVHHRDLQGLTTEETAQLLGLTVNAVKARTFHARRFLRKHFERQSVRTGVLMKLRRSKT
jgi:RNA polymerase sigma-70 factor, ECF subfamily